MRNVTSHLTAGLDDLTDKLEITSDPMDPVNGSGTHQYAITLDGVQVAAIQFQHGPRNNPESVPGITSQALITVLIDHFESFQGGEFKSRENALVITKLQEAKDIMIRRVIDRKVRGVLGELKA